MFVRVCVCVRVCKVRNHIVAVIITYTSADGIILGVIMRMVFVYVFSYYSIFFFFKRPTAENTPPLIEFIYDYDRFAGKQLATAVTYGRVLWTDYRQS